MNSVAAVSLCMITEIVLADLQQVQLSLTPEGKPPPNELSSPRTLLQAEAQSESAGCGTDTRQASGASGLAISPESQRAR